MQSLIKDLTMYPENLLEIFIFKLVIITSAKTGELAMF